MYRKLTLLAAVVLLWAGAMQAQPVVSFSEATTKVTAGETFTVDIVMSDFPVSQGGGLTLRYRPSVLQVTSVTVNDATWSFINKPGNIDNEVGEVKDIIFSAFPGVSGDGVIATIEFGAIKNGRSRLLLEVSPINLFASNGESFVVEFDDAVVQVKKPRRNK